MWVGLDPYNELDGVGFFLIYHGGSKKLINPTHAYFNHYGSFGHLHGYKSEKSGISSLP